MLFTFLIVFGVVIVLLLIAVIAVYAELRETLDRLEYQRNFTDILKNEIQHYCAELVLLRDQVTRLTPQLTAEEQQQKIKDAFFDLPQTCGGIVSYQTRLINNRRYGWCSVCDHPVPMSDVIMAPDALRQHWPDGRLVAPRPNDEYTPESLEQALLGSVA